MEMKNSGILLGIAYVGFISLGLPDTLIGVAWPSVRQSFGLKHGDLSLIFFGAGLSYFISSFFPGKLLRVVNVGVLLGASSGLVAASGFDYGFARSWAMFAAGSLLHGFGSGAIDSGLNHYVATHFAARHMNWLHAFYSLGTMLGPLIMTSAITHWQNWRGGYLVVASILAVLSILFITTQRKWDDGRAAGAESQSTGEKVTTRQTLSNRVAQTQIILFFIYTGLEVAVGQWSFTILTEARGITKEVAGLWTTIYWASIFAGRILFGFVLDRVGIDRIVRFSTLIALIGAALFAWNPWTYAAPVALLLTGFGLSSIFPCLMTRTPQRLGKEMAAHAIGFQVGAAMLGAAVLPSLCGFLAQFTGLPNVAWTTLALAVLLFVCHEVLLAKTHHPTIAPQN